jgi:hypothetical protein
MCYKECHNPSYLVQAIKSALTRNEEGAFAGNVGFTKKILGILFDTTVNSQDGSWSTSVEHDNTYIPNMKSKSEFGVEPGEDDQTAPFFKSTAEYSTDYMVASATVDPFKSEVEFQFTSTYKWFSVGAASQYSLRNGEKGEDEKESVWLPPALKAQYLSEDEKYEVGLKYVPKG